MRHGFLDCQWSVNIGKFIDLILETLDDGLKSLDFKVFPFDNPLVFQAPVAIFQLNWFDFVCFKGFLHKSFIFLGYHHYWRPLRDNVKIAIVGMSGWILLWRHFWRQWIQIGDMRGMVVWHGVTRLRAIVVAVGLFINLCGFVLGATDGALWSLLGQQVVQG